MHNGFLQLESEKMSKSLGNFFTIRDLLADWPGEVLRLGCPRRITARRSTGPQGCGRERQTLDDWYAVAADAEGGQPPA